MVYAKSERTRFDWERFIADFVRSECYAPPLKLEAGKDGTFLETTFRWEGGRFQYRLKNENVGAEPKVWRYKDFRSHGPFAQKRALITMMMRKVHQAASGQQELYESALQKLAEFKRLGYPPGLLRGVCGYMAATTGRGGWILVRNGL